MNEFSESIKPYLNKKIKKCYVALSGGVDSVVLLHELSKFRQIFDFNLIAIHINHNIQKESLSWKKACQKICHEENIKLISRTLRKRKYSSSNLEKNLRDERYKIFEKVLEKNSLLFMGHHLDDAIETFFLRAMRGSGIEGLTSIPIQRNLGNGKLVRPFLNFPKSEIISKAKKDKLIFIQDPSNKDNSFNRNYLRNIAIPKLEKRWPAYRKNLSQLIKNLNEANSVLSIHTEYDFNEVKINKNNILIDKLKNLSLTRQKNVIFYWVNLNGLNQPNAKVINLFFNKFMKDSKSPKAKFIWGSSSKKGSVCILKTSKKLNISKLST